MGTFINYYGANHFHVYPYHFVSLFFLNMYTLIKCQKYKHNMHNIIVMVSCFEPFNNCVNAKVAKLHWRLL